MGDYLDLKTHFTNNNSNNDNFLNDYNCVNNNYDNLLNNNSWLGLMLMMSELYAVLEIIVVILIIAM